MPVIAFNGKKPLIHSSCYIASTAILIGDVTLGENSSVWPCAVIRGDVNQVIVGERTSIQDSCIIHSTRSDPTIIGSDVIIGHGAIAHSCKIGSHVLVGMRATLLNRAIIEDWVIVAAGALLTEGSYVRSKSLVAGVPARNIRTLTKKHINLINNGVNEYVQLSRKYREIYC